MRITSLHLLPQSPQTQLPNHLKFSKVLALLQFFTQQIIAALDAFYIKQYFHEFDPQVGDTACQIRAYYLTLLASNLKSADMFPVYRKLALLKNVLAKIEQDIPFYQKKDTQRQKYSDYTTLEQFIKNNQYCVELNKKELFLTQARMLTCYKTDYRNEPCIDYEKLVAALNVSKNTARQLVHAYQVSLATLSCDFILQLTKQLPQPPINENTLQHLKQHDDDGRAVLPCYWVMKILYSHLLATPKTILVSIKRITHNRQIDKLLLAFTVSEHQNQIVYQKTLAQLPEQPCFVIDGITHYQQSLIETQTAFINRLLHTGIEKVIFLNMAIHPQYSGKKLSTISANPLAGPVTLSQKSTVALDEYLTLRHQAHLFGCSIENPSLFYIEHIFCDTLSRQRKLAITDFQQTNTKKYDTVDTFYQRIEQYASA